MKRDIISYIVAFIAAGACALATFYLGLAGTEIVGKTMRLSEQSLGFYNAAYFFMLAEYIFFGCRDNGAKLAVRFVVHNIFAVTWAFALYGIYSVSDGLQEKYFFSPETVFSILVPETIGGVLKFSAVSAAVCVVIFIVRSIIKRKKQTLDGGKNI